MLALSAISTGVVQLGQEGAHVSGRAHHLVRSSQIGPAAKTEHSRDLLPRREQVEEDLFVFGIGASVVGEEHALAQRGIRGKRHHRLHVWWVRGENDSALGIGRMASNIIGRQSLELGRQSLDGLAPLLNVAAELERVFRRLFVKRLQTIARLLVPVDAGQPVAQQRALNIMLCRWIGSGEIDGRERIVDRAVQAESTSRHGHSLRFHLCLIAYRLVGSDGVEDAGLRACQGQLLDGRIVEAQRILGRARAFDGEECGERRLVRRKSSADPGA